MSGVIAFQGIPGGQDVVAVPAKAHLHVAGDERFVIHHKQQTFGVAGARAMRHASGLSVIGRGG